MIEKNSRTRPIANDMPNFLGILAAQMMKSAPIAYSYQNSAIAHCEIAKEIWRKCYFWQSLENLEKF